MRVGFVVLAGLFTLEPGLLAAQPAATTCQEQGDFNTWLIGVKKEAAAQNISSEAIAEGLGGVTFDPDIISRDHGQKVFHQTFEQFSARMVNSYRLRKGAQLMKRYAGTFERIEKQYGVPAPIIVAVWGLETDFGAVNGDFPTIRALATLAYECRRSEMFRAELFNALRLVQRGDLAASAMRGAWAGELGQTQFMPSSYIKYAVDFEGNGRRDLIHNVPDVLASTANFFKGRGWKTGAGWEPDQPNFVAIQEWNKADVYARTIAYFATELDQTP